MIVVPFLLAYYMGNLVADHPLATVVVALGLGWYFGFFQEVLTLTLYAACPFVALAAVVFLIRGFDAGCRIAIGRAWEAFAERRRIARTEPKDGDYADWYAVRTQK